MVGVSLVKTCRTTTIVLALFVGTSFSKITITCGTRNGETCLQSKPGVIGTKCCDYDDKGTDNINGMLHHNIDFESNGMCFNPRFVFRGLSDLNWSSMDLHELDQPTGIGSTGLKTYFRKEGIPNLPTGKISLCQNIVASREMRYTPCDGKVNYKNCGSTAGNIGVDKATGQEFCRTYFMAKTINPVMNWLKSQSDDDDHYPTVEIANETHISIDWGETVKKFKCGETITNIKNTSKITHTSGSFSIKLKNPEKGINAKTSTNDPFTFSKDYIKIKELTAVEDPRCYALPVEITLKLKFLQLKTTNPPQQYFSSKPIPETEEVEMHSETLSTTIQQSLFAKGGDLETNSEIKSENKTQTYLIIQHEDHDAPINCLKKKVTVEDMNTKNEVKAEIINKNRVDLTPFIIKECEMTRLRITVQDNDGNEVIKKIRKYLPTVNQDQTNSSSETSEGFNYLTVNEAKFENCPHLKFELKCQLVLDGENMTSASQILRYNISTKKSEEYKPEGNYCGARAFLCNEKKKNCNDTSDVDSKWNWFYTTSSAKIDESTIAGAVVGSILGVVAITAVVVFFLRFFEQKTRDDDKEKLLDAVKVKIESSPIPEHVVFKKDDNLGNYLIDITNLQAEVIEEFNVLEKYDEENIKGKETTNQATTQLNLSRNRYKDMVPYDSKLVLLNRATGDPPSRYINASIVQFPTWSQKFLAVQAPKQNMFSGFWQLVMEHNVTVIVMITGLIEGGKVKAHQYWPDENDTVMKLDNGIEVEFLSIDKTKSVFHHRQFKVTNLSNVSITVDHLLCVSWEDMTAPKDTKVLRDLVEMADLLIDEKPGTMMVHCSAGVGRTGTFIGFYKMSQDNDNDEVDRIDPFETTLEMRRARTKMVQKPLQYHYMMKCLSDHVTGETSVYS